MRQRTRTLNPATADSAALIAGMAFELVPIGAVAAAADALPAAAHVTVTCSPTRGIEPTQQLCDELRRRGHRPVPHLAARTVTERRQVAAIASWLRTEEQREVFVIAGDAAAASGPYPDALSFLRELLDHDPGLRRIGVAAYPDGHPFIAGTALTTALHAKQELLASAGVAATATTQMCFDPVAVGRWLRQERSNGLTMPVDLGIPGVVDRRRLLSLGVRLGVGTSLRFLRKQRATMTAMLGGYDPSGLVDELVAATTDLGVTGLHSFTFNSVGPTVAWQRSVIDGAAAGDGA